MRLIDRTEVIPVKEKNVKHLTKTLAVVSLLVPMSAQPLGIGDIRLHSALNQKLNAEIRLQLAAGENPADVTVRLAPPEKFDQAGVPWNYFLSKIKFQPVTQSDGSILIKISSREPLTEPFLDFLLEVNWPQGSQFREFTVLVDPPADYRTPTIPSAESNRFNDEPLETYTAPRRTQVNKKRTTDIKLAANISPDTPTSGEYGPVQNADTLWHIAERLGAERNVPTRQMMAALFRANPEAFNRGNIDLLKAGAVLKIPETDAILQSSSSKQTTTKTKPSNTKSLELVAPTETKVTDISGTIKSGQTGADGSQIKTESGSSMADGKDPELQSRLERLEQQLTMMQQLLALKDQQLAALQKNDTTATAQLPQTGQQTPIPDPAALPNAPSEQPKATDINQQAPAEVKPTPPAAVQPTKPKPPKPVTPPVVAEEEDFFSSTPYYLTLGSLGFGILGVLGWLLWRKRKIEGQTNTESMFDTASQIKMPDSDNSSLSVPVLDMNASSTYDVGTVGESSFISDFTPSDFEAFDTDQTEIDPLSEADVYLAYGRYQQAEELIKHAIEDQPNKDEYKLKLLEIYYANENKAGFALYVQELADAGKTNDRAFWSKVSDMAKEIVPESALFGGTATADSFRNQQTDSNATDANSGSQQARFELDDDFESLESQLDFNADLDDDSGKAESLLDGPEQLEPADNDLDFDLSTFSSSDTTDTDAAEAVDNLAIESIDFDLGNLDSAASHPIEKNQEEENNDLLDNFDFNFDLNDSESSSGINLKKQEQEPLDMTSLDGFEFPEFSEDKQNDKPDQPDFTTDIDNNDSSDEFDFNFDFDAPINLGGDESVGLGVSDLTDMDEFETKIDLAKAYIDMGDSEAAKQIAQEVLEKGSPEQQQIAQTLLNELN